MDIIFNELSIRSFITQSQARESLDTFVRTCIKMRELGFDTIRLSEKHNLYHFEIAPGYLISQWLKDADVDDDLKNRFRDIIFYSHLITDNEPIAKEQYSLSEFKIKVDNKIRCAEGLGIAYLLETLCISFASHNLWQCEEIKNIEYYYLQDNGSEITKKIAVKHASKQSHLAHYQIFFENKKQERLQKSRDLWEKRTIFFPNLTLCGDVKKQLTKVGLQSKYFDQIIDKLKQLNQYAQEWTTGSYNVLKLKDYGLDVTGESISTLRKHSKHRQFRLPNREKKLFEEHIKTGDLRFHFYPDNDTHKIYVGYIGKHLPI